MLIILISAICGLIMVLGGMGLLYKGIITLDKKPVEDALKVEFKKSFKFSTQYPALGLFGIGLVFIIVALHFAETPKVKITGKTQVDANSITKIQIRPGAEFELAVDSDGKISGVIFPNLDQFELIVEASGYEPSPFRKSFNRSEISILGNYDIGDIPLGQVVEKPVENSSNIDSPDFESPPLDDSGGFGGEGSDW